MRVVGVLQATRGERVISELSFSTARDSDKNLLNVSLTAYSQFRATSSDQQL